MLEILGEKYFIDVESIMEVCELQKNKNEIIIPQKETEEIEEVNEHSGFIEPEGAYEINVFKYDTINKCIDKLIHSDIVDIDDSILGVKSAEKLDITYKLAFNTLLHYGILNKE